MNSNIIDDSKIALILSGGGFRATMFHLGVVNYLCETGLINNIKLIASVSGGSILAGHMLANWDKYTGGNHAAMSQKLEGLAQSDLRGHILRRLIPPLIFNSSTRQLCRYYDRFYGYTSFNMLMQSFGKNKKPEFHLLCSNLTLACLASLSSNGFYANISKKAEPIKGLSRFTLGWAVAASSAFPPFFHPVRIYGSDIGADDNEFERNPQYLADGGVIDNLGIQLLTSRIAKRSFDSVILSDASSVPDWNSKRLGYFKGIWRSSELLMAENSRLQIHSMTTVQDNSIYQLSQLPSPKIVHLSISDNAFIENHDFAGLFKTSARIRTDLDRFSEMEASIPQLHGYEIAKNKLSQKFHGTDRSAGVRPSIYDSVYDSFSEMLTEKDSRENTLDKTKSSEKRKWRLISPRDYISWAHFGILLAASLYIFCLHQMLFPSHPPVSGELVPMETVLKHVSRDADDIKEQLKRGLENGLVELGVFNPKPIIYYSDSAFQAISLPFHSTVFIQGDSEVIKIQKFVLPEDTGKVIRANSSASTGKGMKDKGKKVWLFFKDRDSVYIPVNRRSCYRDGIWKLENTNNPCTLYTLAYYGTHRLDKVKNDGIVYDRPYSWLGVEIDDLAPKVDTASMVWGGKFSYLVLDSVYLIDRSDKIQFFNQIQIKNQFVEDNTAAIINRISQFCEFMQDIRSRKPIDGDTSQYDTLLQSAWEVWDETVHDSFPQSGTLWLGIEIINCRNDFIAVYETKNPTSRVNAIAPNEFRENKRGASPILSNR